MRKVALLSTMVSLAAMGAAQSFYEGFEAGPADFTTRPNWGNLSGGENIAFGPETWRAHNLSTPIGVAGWFGDPRARSGDVVLVSTYDSAAGANPISNWMFMPPRIIGSGDTISFWTKVSLNPTNFPDRVSVMQATGITNVPSSFTPVLTVNPGLTATDYPAVYTQFSYTFTGNTQVRTLAFRPHVDNGGPAGSQSDYIFIDDVEFTRAGMTESFDSSTTPGFIDGSVVTFGNSAGGNPIVFPSGTWHALNASVPQGTNGWSRAVSPRTGVGGIATAFNCVGGNNTANNWIMSPVRSIVNGDKIRFWVKATSGFFPDRLHVKLSSAGSSTLVSSFGTPLLTINPTLVANGFPEAYTQYTAVVSGLGAPAVGRFAFHYDVTNSGPDGPNGSELMIDDVEYIPAPASQVISGVIGLSDTGSFGPGVTRRIRAEVRQGGTLVAAHTFVASNPEATYSIRVPHGLSGSATLSFNGSSFLKRNRSLTLSGADQSGVSTVLFNGDVDKSGEVDAADIDEVIASFGQSFPGSGNADADVDVSGEVDAADIDIVISNFGRMDD